MRHVQLGFQCGSKAATGARRAALARGDGVLCASRELSCFACGSRATCFDEEGADGEATGRLLEGKRCCCASTPAEKNAPAGIMAGASKETAVKPGAREERPEFR